MNIEINVTGGGKASELAASLREIANQIQSGTFIAELQDNGEAVIEDGNLKATILEDI